ncbi:MAG: translational GTPase TypA [Flavobacteriales bacterium]|jgi:GTP-binding protein|nr:translational GTPase TypA [Schleiferiaceae bacterium]|tara:strand:+ start:7459 stop:9228 length:1770 start_codon:yes stop_codon:yes gene_type:complete
MSHQSIRNVAIIAHVDHGKTTLMDKILHHCSLFRSNQEMGELILDNNDLERERGITILSKNVSVNHKGVKINLIDTPGHADFGGEVERVLNMADSVLLLVDAFEGPMPQTRFVLQKALELGLCPIVVINKVDKPNCDPELAHEAVFDLMFSLDATEEQLDFPHVYGSAKNNWMGHDWKVQTDSVEPLLDMILEHVPPAIQREGTIQMLVTSLDFSPYTGRMAIGRLHRGTLKENMRVTIAHRDGSKSIARMKELYLFEGLGKVRVKEVQSGDLCAISGIEKFEIGDTVTDLENPEALPTIAIDEPTLSMVFSINDSPFFGKEGKFVTSRHLKDRLDKELERNLALKVKPTGSADSFQVFGRGVLHLSILIETMRREGYELQIGQPTVLFKEIDGVKCEPIEDMVIDLPESKSGSAVELATKRKGELVNMTPKGDRMILNFRIPSRGIIGLRNAMLTATAGEAILNHRLLGYEPMKGDIPRRLSGSLLSTNKGNAFAYSIDRLQDRGTFFIDPGEQIYDSQIVGEHSRSTDLGVNLTKPKKLSNVRASGTDDKVRIAPARKLRLEEALEYIQGDEWVEVTPLSIRLRNRG